MAQPTAYNRNEDFTQRPGDETNHTALNSEFDAAAQSINQIRANLALLQADSGGLKPGIVGPDQLSQAARDSLIPDVAQATADAQAAASSAVASATAANSANAAAQAAKSGAETAASAAALNAQAALAAAQSLNAENLLQKSQNLNDLPDKAAARSALGLGNVNNTSDADKPISIAAQEALNAIDAALNDLTSDVSSGFSDVDNALLAAQSKYVPTGAVLYFSASSSPSGFVKANGAALSRSAYSGLFSVIGTAYGAGDGSTTFNVPDLRGEFIRGFDDGRGVDSGRGIGTGQAGEIQQHSHVVMTIDSAGGATESISKNTVASTLKSMATNNAGGGETRPRNVALLACIKF